MDYDYMNLPEGLKPSEMLEYLINEHKNNSKKISEIIPDGNVKEFVKNKDNMDFLQKDFFAKIFRVPHSVFRRRDESSVLRPKKQVNYDNVDYGDRIGSGNSNAKLNELDVMHIKDLMRKGLSDVQICDRYPVSVATISSIRKGKSWKHVK